MNEITVSSGSFVESAERAAASHEGSSSERGGVEGRKAPAAAEAESWSGGARCLSGVLVASASLVAETASFQTAPSLTATRSGVTTSVAEAFAPSKTNAGFGRTSPSLFTSTRYRYC